MHKMKTIRVTIDTGLLVLVFVQMSIAYLDPDAHEWTGIALGILCVVHLVVNLRRLRSLFRGRSYLRSVVDIVLLAWIVVEMCTGLALSSAIAPGLALRKGREAARLVHAVAAHWGFLLVAVHVGLHGAGRGRRTVPKSRKVISALVVLALVAGGVFSCVQLDFVSYLIPRNTALFLSAREPFWLHLTYLLLLFSATTATVMALGRIFGRRRQGRARR